MSQGQTDGCYLVTGHRTDFTADCAAVAYVSTGRSHDCNSNMRQYANFKLGGGNDGEQPDDFVFVAIGQPSTHIDNYNFTGQQSKLSLVLPKHFLMLTYVHRRHVSEVWSDLLLEYSR